MLDYNSLKPKDLSYIPNIISAYNFIPSPEGILTDIAGSDNGTIVGAVSTNNGLYFSGNSGYVTIGDIGNIKSISFRIKVASATEKIMQGAAGSLLIHVNTRTLTCTDFDNVYVNGVYTDAIVPNEWQNVVITSSTNVNFSALTLGLNTATYGEFELADLRFYSDEKSSLWAVDYHRDFAHRMIIRNSFADYGVGADQNDLSGSMINVTSGTFSIGELSSQDVNVPQLDKQTKYIECDTNGVFQILYSSVNSLTVDALIDFYDGSNWSRKEDSLESLISANSWLSQSGDYLIFTLTAGDGVTTNLIRKGIEQ